MEEVLLPDIQELIKSGEEEEVKSSAGIEAMHTGAEGKANAFLRGMNDATMIPQASEQLFNTPQEQRINSLSAMNRDSYNTVGEKVANFAGEMTTTVPFFGATASMSSKAVRSSMDDLARFTNRAEIAANKRASSNLSGSMQPFEQGPAYLPKPDINTGARIKALDNATDTLSQYHPSGSIINEGLAQEVLSTPLGVAYDYSRANVDGQGENFNPLVSTAENFVGGMALGTPLAYMTSKKARAANDITREFQDSVKRKADKDGRFRFDTDEISNMIEVGEARISTGVDGSKYFEMDNARIPMTKSKKGYESFKVSQIEFKDPANNKWINANEAVAKGHIRSLDDLLPFVENYAEKGKTVGGKKQSEAIPRDPLTKDNVKFSEDDYNTKGDYESNDATTKNTSTQVLDMLARRDRVDPDIGSIYDLADTDLERQVLRESLKASNKGNKYDVTIPKSGNIKAMERQGINIEQFLNDAFAKEKVSEVKPEAMSPQAIKKTKLKLITEARDKDILESVNQDNPFELSDSRTERLGNKVVTNDKYSSKIKSYNDLYSSKKLDRLRDTPYSSKKLFNAELKRRVNDRIEELTDAEIDAYKTLANKRNWNKDDLSGFIKRDIINEEAGRLLDEAEGHIADKKTAEDIKEAIADLAENKPTNMSEEKYKELIAKKKEVDEIVDSGKSLFLSDKANTKTAKGMSTLIHEANAGIDKIDTKLKEANKILKDIDLTKDNKQVRENRDMLLDQKKDLMTITNNLRDILNEQTKLANKEMITKPAEVDKDAYKVSEADKIKAVDNAKFTKLAAEEADILNNYNKVSDKPVKAYKDIPFAKHASTDKVKRRVNKMLKKENKTFTKGTTAIDNVISRLEDYSKKNLSSEDMTAINMGHIDSIKNMYNRGSNKSLRTQGTLNLLNKLSETGNGAILLENTSPIIKALYTFGEEAKKDLYIIDLSRKADEVKASGKDVDRTGDKTVTIGETSQDTLLLDKNRVNYFIQQYVKVDTLKDFSEADFTAALSGGKNADNILDKIFTINGLEKVINQFRFNADIDKTQVIALLSKRLKADFQTAILSGSNDIMAQYKYDLNKLSRQDKTPIKGKVEYNKAIDMIDSAAAASVGSNVDIGLPESYIPTVGGSMHLSNNRGASSHMSIYNNISGKKQIDEINKSRGNSNYKGFYDRDGNVYLNNDGKVNEQNLKTVLHELAHQFQEANGFFGNSKGEVFNDEYADGIYNRILDHVNKLTGSNLKPTTIPKTADRLVPSKDMDKFEGYIANSLNDPNSGIASWLGAEAPRISSIEPDIMSRTNNVFKKQGEIFKSVGDFIDDLIDESPTLSSALNRSSKRMTSVVSAQRIQATSKQIQQQLAEFTKRFDEMTGNMSESDLNAIGDLVTAGGGMFAHNPRLLESFLNGHTPYKAALEYAEKRFATKLSHNIAEDMLNRLDFDKHIAAKKEELDKILQLLTKNELALKQAQAEGKHSDDTRNVVKELDDPEAIVSIEKAKELTDKIHEIEAQSQAISYSKEKLGNVIAKQINDYVTNKKLIESESTNIANEKYYRTGFDQNTGAKRVFTSVTTKEFGEGLTNTILKHKIETGYPEIDKMLETTMKDMKTDGMIHDAFSADASNLQKVMDVVVAGKRLNNLSSDTLKDIGRIYGSNAEGVKASLAIWNDMNRALKSENIDTMQFGANPLNMQKLKDRKLRFALRAEDGIPDSAVAATPGNGEVRLVVDDTSANLGKQNSVLITDQTNEQMTIRSNKLGVEGNNVTFTLENGNKIVIGDKKDFNMKRVGPSEWAMTLKTKDLTKDQNVFSTNIKSMYENNMKRLMFNRYGKKASNDYVASMVAADIIRPMSEVKGNKDFSEKVFEHDGMKYLVDKRYTHNVFGTKGIEITNKYAAGLVKGFQGLRDIVKSKILNTRLKSYLNSIVANNITLSVSTGMSFSKLLARNDQAKADLDSFSNLAQDKGLRAARKKYPDVYDFFYKFGGNDSIMRDTIRNNGKVAPNQLLTMMEGMTNSQLIYDVRNTNAIDGSKTGDALASLFDATEIKQKLNYYRWNIEKGLSKEKAIEEVFSAFPTYAENLTDVMSLVDEIVLFSKYMNNVPKLFRHGMDKSPGKMLTMFASMIALKEAGYLLFDENQADGYMKEYGMAKVGPNSYANFSSMNNYNLSSIAETNVVNYEALMDHSTLLGAEGKLFSRGAE